MSFIAIDTSEVDRFNGSLGRYVALSKKTPAQVVHDKGRDLSIRLFQSFRKLAPERGEVAAQAQALGFRLGKLSPSAIRLAEQLMEGQKSVAGSVIPSAGVAGLIRTVRVGKRGKRVTGGRRGTGGRAATAEEARQFKHEDEYFLNKRAVATFFEVMLRERGRQSLAISWLHKQWRKRASKEQIATGQHWRLERINPKAEAKFQGAVEFNSADNHASLLISSMIPGVGKYPAQVDEALRGAVEDMAVYIARKQDEAWKEAFGK